MALFNGLIWKEVFHSQAPLIYKVALNFHSYLQELKLSTIDYFLMALRLKTEGKGVCSLGEQFIPHVISPPLEMLNGQHQRKGKELLGTFAQHLNLKLFIS